MYCLGEPVPGFAGEGFLWGCVLGLRPVRKCWVFNPTNPINQMDFKWKHKSKYQK